jgi:hypothetical protein
MTLSLKGKGEDEPTLATPLEEMVASPTRATRLELVSPTLNLKGEEMPTHATTLECSDSDAAACPTTTNSLKPMHPATNAGQDSPKSSTRPTQTNAAEMPGMKAEMSTCPMLPPTRPTSSAWLPHPLLRPSPSHRRVPHVLPALL